jgi:hypothetical protein
MDSLLELSWLLTLLFVLAYIRLRKEVQASHESEIGKTQLAAISCDKSVLSQLTSMSFSCVAISGSGAVSFSCWPPRDRRTWGYYIIFRTKVNDKKGKKIGRRGLVN